MILKANYENAGSLIWKADANSLCMIKNCYVNSNQHFATLVEKGSVVDISNSIFINSPEYPNKTTYGAGNVIIKNSTLKYISSKKNFSLGGFAGASSESVVLKNVIIDLDLTLSSAEFFQYDNYTAQGVIVNFNLDKRSDFYGNDFSGFYHNFKTGEVGLKAFSGRGLYQGGVTEDFLLKKGYSKKEGWPLFFFVIKLQTKFLRLLERNFG